LCRDITVGVVGGRPLDDLFSNYHLLAEGIRVLKQAAADYETVSRSVETAF
jgi:hypothetical protein